MQYLYATFSIYSTIYPIITINVSFIVKEINFLKRDCQWGIYMGEREREREVTGMRSFFPF